jgi:hypothetical protein
LKWITAQTKASLPVEQATSPKALLFLLDQLPATSSFALAAGPITSSLKLCSCCWTNYQQPQALLLLLDQLPATASFAFS